MIRIFSQYVSPKSLLLMAIESLLMSLALVCGVFVRFWNEPLEFDSYIQFPDFAVQVVIFVMIFQICFYYSDLYNVHTTRTRYEQLLCVGQSLGAGCLALGLVYYIFPSLLIGRGVFFISTALAATFVMVSRIALDRAWQFAAPKQNVLILGTHELAVTVARELTRRGDLNLQLLGFVQTAGCTDQQQELFGRPIVGSADKLEAIATEKHVARIIVALEDRRLKMPTRDLVKLRVQGVRVEDAHSTISSLSGRVWLNTVQPSWFVFTDGFHRSRTTMVLKRMIDLSVALVALTLLLPIMLLLAIAIRLDSKGPAIYRQRRVGYRGQCFDMLKFRSMCADAEKLNGAAWAQKDDPRVTRVGRFIRKCRLDELPQLINIIGGDMSFIGPRPERPVFVEQLRQQISYYDERHSVRPGLSGWAQVQYGYGASVEDAIRKLEYDLFYLKNLSVLFDFAIMLRTVRIVLTGNGGR
jgi:sugar transferase (PEP-CTERM system associated)